MPIKSHIELKAMNNLFNPESRSNQTNNFNPTYADNPNAFMDWEVTKAQSVGLNLVTENPIGAGIANAFTNGVLGSGLELEAFIDRTLIKGATEKEISEIQNKIESYWKVWSRTPSMCDFYQKDSLANIETLALKSIIGEGDGLLHVGIVKNGNVYYPQIQWINGSSVVTPPSKLGDDKVLSGVEIDANGRDIAYYVKECKGNDFNTTYKRCAVKSRNRDTIAFQLVKFNEIQQGVTRGRSMLIPVKDLLIQSGRYVESEVTKAIIQSYMTFFITQDKEVEEDGETSTTEEILNNSTTINTDEGYVPSTEEENRVVPIGPGVVAQLKPGEKVDLPESKSPTAGFKEFMETLLKLTGMAVNIPYEVLLKSFNSSYSASQASLQEAARGYEIFRDEFVTKFMMPIYISFVDCLVLQGIITCKDYDSDIFARSAWLGSNWHGPTTLNIDPVKNAKAAILAIDAKLTTREIEARKLYGNEWFSVAKRLKKEQDLIGELFPEPVIEGEGSKEPTVTEPSAKNSSSKTNDKGAKN